MADTESSAPEQGKNLVENIDSLYDTKEQVVWNIDFDAVRPLLQPLTQLREMRAAEHLALRFIKQQEYSIAFGLWCENVRGLAITAWIPCRVLFRTVDAQRLGNMLECFIGNSERAVLTAVFWLQHPAYPPATVAVLADELRAEEVETVFTGKGTWCVPAGDVLAYLRGERHGEPAHLEELPSSLRLPSPIEHVFCAAAGAETPIIRQKGTTTTTRCHCGSARKQEKCCDLIGPPPTNLLPAL